MNCETVKILKIHQKNVSLHEWKGIQIEAIEMENKISLKTREKTKKAIEKK